VRILDPIEDIEPVLTKTWPGPDAQPKPPTRPSPPVQPKKPQPPHQRPAPPGSAPRRQPVPAHPTAAIATTTIDKRARLTDVSSGTGYDIATRERLADDRAAARMPTGTRSSASAPRPFNVNVANAAPAPAGNRQRSGAAKAISLGVHVVLDLGAVAPYVEYYAAYQTAKALNTLGRKGGATGSIASHILASPLALEQAQGLFGDALIDLLKGESIHDEQIHAGRDRGFINPLHSYLPRPFKGPRTYLPGIGKHGIDFQW